MTTDEWSLAGAPDGQPAVPAAVSQLVGGEPVRCVWNNALGGMTFEVGDGTRFLKWAPAGNAVDLLGEAARLQWARPYTPVPEVLGTGVADDGSTWLLTAALTGTTAVADRWKAAPHLAVRAIGEGLRAFHDALPVESCPFTCSTDERVARTHVAAESDAVDPSRWHPAHRHLTVEGALAVLDDPPAPDVLVVCHGDTCAPNTLLADDGRWSGHVDLGALGVGDRWADLAVATWSTEWNDGTGWEDELLAAYGIAPDPERTRWFRLLWDLAD